jgi:hypothetical protein
LFTQAFSQFFVNFHKILELLVSLLFLASLELELDYQLMGPAVALTECSVALSFAQFAQEKV